VSGIETDPTPCYAEVDGATVALKSRSEAALEQRAIRAIAEYRMVKDGITSYDRLGHGLPGGEVVEFKLREYLVIEALINDANEERDRRNA
jgi:hypothetical protein